MKRLIEHALNILLLSLILIAPAKLFAQQPEKNPVIEKLEKQIAGRENEPAAKVFKNIKIFKDMPAIRLLRLMERGFSPALGVKCTFCHVKDEWDSDEKPEKQRARGMIKMVGEIRKKLHDIVDEKATINCYTCHRGDPEPALRPKRKGKGKMEHAEEKEEHEHRH